MVYISAKEMKANGRRCQGIYRGFAAVEGGDRGCARGHGEGRHGSVSVRHGEDLMVMAEGAAGDYSMGGVRWCTRGEGTDAQMPGL